LCSFLATKLIDRIGRRGSIQVGLLSMVRIPMSDSKAFTMMSYTAIDYIPPSGSNWFISAAFLIRTS